MYKPLMDTLMNQLKWDLQKGEFIYPVCFCLVSKCLVCIAVNAN